MSVSEQDENLVYLVVLNKEEQYSIWPDDKEIPQGWQAEGTKGSKEQCLDHIEKVWTDMRPLSLRKEMEKAKDRTALPQANSETSSDINASPIPYLTEGTHPVVISRVDNDVAKLKANVDRNFVMIKFTDTKGGTELGVSLDEGSDLSHCDFDNKQGKVHLEGTLILDFVKVRCIADIELNTLEGTGHLEVVEKVMG